MRIKQHRAWARRLIPVSEYDNRYQQILAARNFLYDIENA